MTDTIVAEDASGSSSELLAREVLIHGPVSRAELGRRLGLSPASLTRLARPFLDGGDVGAAVAHRRAPARRSVAVG